MENFMIGVIAIATDTRYIAMNLLYNFCNLYNKFVANGKVCDAGVVAIARDTGYIVTSFYTIFIICIASSSLMEKFVMKWSSQLRRHVQTLRRTCYTNYENCIATSSQYTLWSS
jgi:hypothetical protein